MPVVPRMAAQEDWFSARKEEAPSGSRHMKRDRAVTRGLERRFFGGKAHLLCTCRRTPGSREIRCYVTSCQRLVPDAMAPTGSAWQLAARQHAWHHRKPDSARQWSQHF